MSAQEALHDDIGDPGVAPSQVAGTPSPRLSTPPARAPPTHLPCYGMLSDYPTQQPVTQTAADHDVQHGQEGNMPRAAAVVTNALSDQKLTPKQRLLRDELGFVAGVANIACAP